MDVYQSGYYKDVRKNMCYSGLWPYDDKKKRLFIQCFIIFVLYTSLILQISGFLLLPYSTELFLKFIIRISPSVYSAYGYIVILIKRKEVKVLIDQIRNDCNLVLLKNDKSKKMIEVCGKNIKQVTSTYIYLFTWVGITQIFILILSIIWDKTITMNESKMYKYPISIGYYEQFQSNFAIIFLALCFVPITEIFVSLGICIFMIHLIEHSCLMFSINGNLFEQHTLVEKKSKSGITQNVQIYNMLVTIIKYHNQNIRFLNDINDIFEKNSLCAILLSLCVLTIDLLYFFDIKYMVKEYNEVFLNISLLIGHLLFLIVFCHKGQCISNHGSNFFMKVYNYQWYVTSPELQRMYLLILMKSIDPIYISVGKVFRFSYELIASILNTSISYALVLHSR